MLSVFSGLFEIGWEIFKAFFIAFFLSGIVVPLFFGIVTVGLVCCLTVVLMPVGMWIIGVAMNLLGLVI